MKKLMVMIAVAASAAGLFAGPCGPGGGRGCGGGGCRPAPGCHRPCAPRPGGPGWHCGPRHGGWWGRGGCNFWPGFVGGVLGGAITSAIVDPAPAVVTTPVVVQQPVVVTQPATSVTQTQSVWVEGRYVDQVQADGSVLRVWSPGHYEQRTVVVQ